MSRQIREAFPIHIGGKRLRPVRGYAGSFIICASFGHLGVDCSFIPVVCRKKNTAG